MGVRDWVNNHPRTAAIVAGVGVVLCVAGVGYELRGDPQPAIGAAPNHYYTIDDGKTVFTANGSNVAPFEYPGGTAVRVHMFDADGKRFIGYLERYTPDARRAKVAKAITPQQEMEGREVKKPGDAAWVSTGDRAAVSRIIVVPKLPGSASAPVPVEP